MRKISDKELEKLLSLHKSGKEVIDLSGTDLSNRDLSGVYLEEANLENAFLAGCELAGADLRISNLEGADLTYANLSEANLACANLTGANLESAILTRAQLQETTLKKTNLTNADLKWVDFREADLSEAILNGANLYLSAFDSWVIKNIKCTHVYWDQEEENRNPPNRDFYEGEFEQLHKSLPTIEYYFENGFTPIDALLIEKAVSEITTTNPEFELELESYQIRGAVPRMKMTVKSKQYKDLAYSKLKGRYEELAKHHEEQRNQISDITLALISRKTESIYNIQGNMKLKNKITSDRSNIMLNSSNSSQEINNQENDNLDKIIENIVEAIENDDAISKSEYISIKSDIKTLQENLKNEETNNVTTERVLSNLGSVASISSLASQLASLIV